MENTAFHTDTPMARGLRELFAQLSDRLELNGPLNVYLAGGMAVHLYTANRVTTDVDAEFGRRIFVPNDLMVEVTLAEGKQQVIYLDTNYNSTFALMNEDYIQDSLFVDFGLENMNVHVLSPVDLVVSKIARFAENDRADIRAIVELGLTSADAIEKRANDALVGYVGNHNFLLLNLRDTLEMARKIETENALPASLLLSDEEIIERDRRIQNVGNLKRSGGPAYTFWRAANEALSCSGDGNVDWHKVEDGAFQQGISRYGQDPNDVLVALFEHSPGAVSQQQRDQLSERVLSAAPSLKLVHENRKISGNDYSI